MEIKITSLLVEGLDAWNISNSVANLGKRAAQITWNNARKRAKQAPQLLQQPNELEAFRNHMEEMGFGYDEDLDSFTHLDWNALFLQLIAGDLRDAGYDSLEDVDWEDDHPDGDLGGRMFKGTDGELYYYIGE